MEPSALYDMGSIQTGLGYLFTVKTLAFLALGFALGFVVGAIPGFNDANLMAILLPFTLLMDPMTAIIAMSALYFAAQAAGSIPAILINVPGTGGTAASTIEGYPMAQQGKAGFALGVSLGASTVGAFFGASAALVFAPIFGTFALRFGPAELFMVALFGLTVVSALTGDNLPKGLVATALGLLFAFVGADSATAFERGSFGVLELWDGLPLVPVILGLFGFSELLLLLRQQSVARKELSFSSEREILNGFFHALKYRITLLRSSVVGTIIGFIPGAGAAIGTFVCYGMAKQWSREKEKFGTGHPDGLVATDSGNNAVAAGAVVPLLTLGLPGSASTTLMLAALFLHGVQPGPRLFINFQSEAYAILFSLFISAALVPIVGLPVARYFKRVAYTPTKILVPVVFVLLFVGAFAWRFIAFDIVIMIFFGLVGVAMKIYNYPVPAFLLAFILGPIIEDNYLRATRIGEHEIFFSSGICITLWVLCVVSLLAPLFLHARDGRLPSGDEKTV